MDNSSFLCGDEIIATALYLFLFLFFFNNIIASLLLIVTHIRSQHIIVTWLDVERDLRMFLTFFALFAFGNKASPIYLS